MCGQGRERKGVGGREGVADGVGLREVCNAVGSSLGLCVGLCHLSVCLSLSVCLCLHACKCV